MLTTALPKASMKRKKISHKSNKKTFSSFLFSSLNSWMLNFATSGVACDVTEDAQDGTGLVIR